MPPKKPEEKEDEFCSFTQADADNHFRNWDISRVPVPKELTPEQIEMQRAFIEMREQEADEFLTKCLLEAGMKLEDIQYMLAALSGTR